MDERLARSVEEAKKYVHKIRHETLRISVIERLEEYLGLKSTPLRRTVYPPPVDENDEDENEDRDNTAVVTPSPTPTEPEVGMLEDQCKRLFLSYYDIYLVLPFSQVPVLIVGNYKP
jgi:ubiquitin-conjugating enzyme E2 Z